MNERNDTESFFRSCLAGDAAKRLALALRAGRMGTWTWDPVSDEADWDEELERIIGLRSRGAGHTCARAFLERIEAIDLAKVRADAEQTLAHGGHYAHEFRFHHPDGRVLWLAGHGMRVTEPGSGARLIVGVNFDVTGRVATEDARRESESFYRQTLESIPGMAFTNRPDGYCDYVSQQWVHFTGVPAAAHLGSGWVTVVHPDDRSRAFAAWRSAVEQRGHYDLEYRVRRHDGTYEWFKVRGQALRDSAGRIARWFGTAVNVNDLKEIELRLRDRQQQLKLAGDAAGVGFWNWDLRANVITHDEVSAAMLALPANVPVPGANALATLHVEDRERVETAARLAGGEGDRYDVEFRVVRPDGSVCWLAGRGNVVSDTGGPRLLGVNWDITARRVAEDQRLALLESERTARADAERASRLKDEFLATVSHELRTPLNAIAGWTHVLLSGRLDPAETARALAAIDRNARAQARLVDDLLDTGRVLSGKVRLDVTPVALDQIVAAAIAAVSPAAATKGITLTAPGPADHAVVNGDVSRLTQVVCNLLNNAVKFTPAHGHVRVSLRCVGGRAQLVVADNGEGIDADFVPHLFERFRQADGTTSRPHAGLGIGLSIVKQLVDLHGGLVHGASEGRGLGATFTVELPLSAATAARDARTGERDAAEEAVALGDLTGLTVLAVDDDVESLAVLQRIMQERGATVLTVEGAEPAYQAIATCCPDIVISDIGMPGIDGYEFMRRVRQLPNALRHVPAIALTAYVRPSDRDKALAAGYDAYLSKPLDPPTLLNEVIRLIPSRRTL